MPNNHSSKSSETDRAADTARLLDPREKPTLPIAEAGALLGLDRSASYRAARSGFLPTLQVSERRWVVPTAALMGLLGLAAPSTDPSEEGGKHS